MPPQVTWSITSQVSVQCHHIAGVDQHGVFLCNAHELGQFLLCNAMTVFTVDRNGKFRMDQ